MKLSILRGDNYTLNLTVKTSTGALQDLTGYKAFFTVVAALDEATVSVVDSTALISKTIASIPAPTTGVISFALTSTDTNVATGVYFYDVQIEDAGGVVTTILPPDQITITPDVTRRLT